MSDDLVSEWTEKAEEDWRALSHLQTNALADVPNVVVFHSQQCAEKCLKALIQRDGNEPPRIHHLPALLDSLLTRHPDLETLRTACEGLSPYAVDFRYPGNAASSADAEAAIAFAEQVRATTRAKLGRAGDT